MFLGIQARVMVISAQGAVVENPLNLQSNVRPLSSAKQDKIAPGIFA